MSVYYYHRKNKKRYTITPYVVSCDIAGGVDKFYQTATLVISASAGVPYDTGERIRVYTDSSKLLFEGRVFKCERNGDSSVSLTCHDNAYYLYRSEATVVSQEITLEKLFKRMVEELGQKVGYVAKTKKVYFGLEFVGETRQSILQTVMGMERAATKKRYYIRSNAGKLELRERGAAQGVVITRETASEVRTTTDAQNAYTAINYTAEIESGAKATGTSDTSSTMRTVADYKGPDTVGSREGLGSSIAGTDKWNDLMVKVGKEKGIDPLFLKVIMTIESGGNELAIGPPTRYGQAIGLFQIIPGAVDTPVDANRLRTAEYNTKKAADIFLNEKGNAAKNRGVKMSVGEMAHFWFGYLQTAEALAYKKLAETLYAGFGGDPDSLITDPDKIPSGGKAKKSESKTMFPSVDNIRLGSKIGVIVKELSGKFASKEEMNAEIDKIQKTLLREERSVTVSMMGHVAGIAGRKVDFDTTIATAKGAWYVKDHRHTLDQYGHKMTLTLSKYDETPEPEYAPPANSEFGDEKPVGVKGAVLPIDKGKYTVGAYRFKSVTWYSGGKSTHSGIDLLAPIGTPLKAVTNLLVMRNYYSDSYGWCVIAQGNLAGGEKQFVYAHMNTMSPHKAGSYVKVGEQIGVVGTTGWSTAPHLHFEVCDPVWVQGLTNKLDPEKFFDF
ncbi:MULTISPECIES: peptidoglycan DD-metalloendopeptidase family protein [unclassified Exiguobacterium]|uniref:XkdQ/YqbQ family protein n=1 Tax=unclassified Exiguobacterium TaxID=2644629 RepID=UPI0025B8DB33|nr:MULTISPECIES: peptidoglycan DD-metalloendopeptidase family protein [unclassified Exiguobacterium]